MQRNITIAFKKANVYMDKLVEYGLIEPLDGGRSHRNLIPKNVDEINAEVLELLEKHNVEFVF